MSKFIFYIIFSCISLAGLYNQPVSELGVETEDDIICFKAQESQTYTISQLFDLDEDCSGKLKLLAFKKIELYCYNDSPQAVKVYINPFFSHHILFEADSSPPNLTVLV